MCHTWCVTEYICWMMHCRKVPVLRSVPSCFRRYVISQSLFIRTWYVFFCLKLCGIRAVFSNTNRILFGTVNTFSMLLFWYRYCFFWVTSNHRKIRHWLSRGGGRERERERERMSLDAVSPLKCHRHWRIKPFSAFAQEQTVCCSWQQN
jgi:hypothetical protein